MIGGCQVGWLFCAHTHSHSFILYMLVCTCTIHVMSVKTELTTAVAIRLCVFMWIVGAYFV